MIEGDATIAVPDPLAPVPLAAAAPARSRRAIFARRLLSAVALWSVFLGTLLSGNTIAYFLLIGSVGMAGLWEFYGMLDRKPVPNFKLFGMICAGIFFGLSFYFLSARNGSAHSNNFEMAVLLIFLLGVFGRQLFTRARENIPPLETMAYTVFGLLYVPWLFNFITKIIFLVPRDAQRRAPGPILRFLPHRGGQVQRHGRLPDRAASSAATKWCRISARAKPGKGSAARWAFSLAGQLRVVRADAGQARACWDFGDATILGLTLSVAAVIGDLAESILKRSTGVKDSGQHAARGSAACSTSSTACFSPHRFSSCIWCSLSG